MIGSRTPSHRVGQRRPAASRAEDRFNNRHGMVIQNNGDSLAALQQHVGNQTMQRLTRDGCLSTELLVGARSPLGNQAIQRLAKAMQTTSSSAPEQVQQMSGADSIRAASLTIQRVAIPTDLHAFGNSSAPRKPRAGTDMEVDDEGMVHKTEPPTGASTFGDPEKAPLTGHYHQIAKGVDLGAGLDVIADGKDAGGSHAETHHTVFPSETMTFDAFSDKFIGLGWAHAGNKKPGKK